MTKRDALEPQGRTLFVIHGMSKTDVAARLGVSLRTVQIWSKDNKDGRGTWDEQKAAVTTSPELLHQEIMAVAVTLTRCIKDDLMVGKLDPKAVANLDRVMKSAIKAIEYQRKSPPKAEANQTAKQKRERLQGELRHKLGLA